MPKRPATDEFVHHANIAYLKAKYLVATDPVQRQVVLRVLTDQVIHGERNGWQSDL